MTWYWWIACVAIGLAVGGWWYFWLVYMLPDDDRLRRERSRRWRL